VSSNADLANSANKYEHNLDFGHAASSSPTNVLNAQRICANNHSEHACDERPTVFNQSELSSEDTPCKFINYPASPSRIQEEYQKELQKMAANLAAKEKERKKLRRKYELDEVSEHSQKSLILNEAQERLKALSERISAVSQGGAVKCPEIKLSGSDQGQDFDKPVCVEIEEESADKEQKSQGKPVELEACESQLVKLQKHQDLGRKHTATLERETETPKREIELLKTHQAAKDEADLQTLQEVLAIAEQTQAELDRVLQEKEEEVARERAEAEHKIEALKQQIAQKDDMLKMYETKSHAHADA
jgi:hypothetical protein